MSKINKTFSNGQPLDAKDLNDLAAGINNAVPIDAESGVTKDGDNYYIKDADGNVLTVPHTSVGAMIADYIKNNSDQQAKVTFGASSLQALQTTIGTNLYGATTAAGLASVVAGKNAMLPVYSKHRFDKVVSGTALNVPLDRYGYYLVCIQTRGVASSLYARLYVSIGENYDVHQSVISNINIDFNYYSTTSIEVSRADNGITITPTYNHSTTGNSSVLKVVVYRLMYFFAF